MDISASATFIKGERTRWGDIIKPANATMD